MFFIAQPLFVSRPWGSSYFQRFFPGLKDAPVGEVWLLSGLCGSETPVFEPEASANTRESEFGQYHGQPLAYPSSFTAQWTGISVKRFPVLIKLLRAREWLSVQVHPDDRMARKEEHEPWGKSEFWVVLDSEADTAGRAEEEGLIIDGIAEDSTPEKVAASIQRLGHGIGGQYRSEGSRELFHFSKPAKGEIIELPSGTVHALGPGIWVLEVQQASDITYRLFDWGRDRPIHLQKGLQAIHWDQKLAIRKHIADGMDNPLFRLEYISEKIPTVSAETSAKSTNDSKGHATDLKYRTGFCVLVSPDSLLVDGYPILPWHAVVVPAEQKVEVKGHYFVLSLGEQWKYYLADTTEGG